MRPTLISYRRRLCRSLVGFVIAILTAHGPLALALSTFAAVCRPGSATDAVAQSRTRSSGGYSRPGATAPVRRHSEAAPGTVGHR